MKDNFSKQSGLYAQFRPQYPRELVAFLLSHVPGRSLAWDSGTGNGQFARELARVFETVCATDVSPEQISHARPGPNIRYSVGAAEASSFPDGSFDLVCAAQAVRWFDFGRLYQEVYRVLKPSGVFAVAGYSLCTVGQELDPALRTFYTDVVGPYWDAERHLVDAHYRTIPFPLREIPCPEFAEHFQWTVDEFIGYVRTWSAVQHYVDAMSADPTESLRTELVRTWHRSVKRDVAFPFFLRMGTPDERLLDRHHAGGAQS